MPQRISSEANSLNWTLMMMRLTGIGIIASGAATAAVPEMRTLMIPSFAVCATIFAITLLSTLSKPKVTRRVKERASDTPVVELATEALMDSFEDDNSHLILISSPYFVQQAKITPNKGVTPDSIVKCEASARGLPEQNEPTIIYSWRNASTGAFLGTRSQLDLTSTLVRPGQSIECLVTAEDDCGDMATSLAKVLIEANLTMSETPTERFSRKELQSRREALKKADAIHSRQRRVNKGRRSSDNESKMEKIKTDSPRNRSTERKTPTKRQPLRQIYEGEDNSNIFTPMGMWD